MATWRLDDGTLCCDYLPGETGDGPPGCPVTVDVMAMQPVWTEWCDVPPPDS